MHLKEQYNKTLIVDIGWISTQTRFFHKFKALNDFK